MDWGRMDLGWIATTPGEEEENNSVGEGWIERARENSDEHAWENSDERARDISSTVAEGYFGATPPARASAPDLRSVESGRRHRTTLLGSSSQHRSTGRLRRLARRRWLRLQASTGGFFL